MSEIFMPGKSYTPPSREGRRSFTLWLPVNMIEDLKRVSYESKRSLQEIGEDALAKVITAHDRKKTK
jgi:hypothetical protein